MAKLDLWHYKATSHRLAGVKVTLSNGLESPIFRTDIPKNFAEYHDTLEF